MACGGATAVIASLTGGTANRSSVNFCASRMVDDHQLQIVVVVGLPQLARKPQIVVTIVRRQLIAANLVPFFGSRDFGGTDRIDLQTNGGAPGHCILHEGDLLAVPCK